MFQVPVGGVSALQLPAGGVCAFHVDGVGVTVEYPTFAAAPFIVAPAPDNAPVALCDTGTPVLVAVPLIAAPCPTNAPEASLILMRAEIPVICAPWPVRTAVDA